MWNVKFPETPEGEEVLVVYYNQKSSMYIKETKKGNVLLRYYWDGVCVDFNTVEADIIID